MRDLKKNSHLTLRIVILVMILLGVIILITVDPSKSPWLPKCPIWLATGLYCPGCGSQRAAHALFTGHFAEVFRFNPYLLFANYSNVAATYWNTNIPYISIWRPTAFGLLSGTS